MHDGMEKGSLVISRKQHILICALAGLLILGGVLGLSAHSDLQNAEKQFEDTISYVKEQCTGYDNLNLATEAKSLMRVMENAQHLCSEIARDQQENPGRVLDDAAMEEYLQDYTLSGILVLSAEGKILCGASQDGRVADPQVRTQMEKELAGSIVLKVADHPQQVYAGRTEKEDSSYVDTAACARKDGDGVLVVYYRTTAEYVRNYSLSYQNCVQGYNPAVDGIIVVTRGDRIVASNDTSLLDTTVDENPTLSALKARSTDGGMIHVHSTTGRQYAYGIVGQGRSFYIYVYRPEQEVYVSTMRNVSMAAFAYMVVLFLLQLLRGKTARRYREQQLRREQEYQETLKAAALKAESANLAKTEFLQRMSHDIRTPINGIRGMVEIGDRCPEDMARQADCRKKIWEASTLLLELVNEVLDMGKLESGEVVLENVPFDLPELMHEITEMERLLREHPEEFPPSLQKGRMVERLSKKMGIARATVQEYQQISRNLLPEAMEKFKEGEIEKSAALTLARLPEKMQKEVIEQGITKNVDIEEYKPACLRIYIRIQKTPSGCFQAAVTPLNFRMVLLFVNDIIDYAFDRWSDMNQGSDDILPFISPQR